MRFAAALALLLLAAPLAAAEDVGDGEDSRLAAAGWCVVHSGEAAADQAPGCDVGVGVALHRWGKLSAVAVLGAETLGAGLAWTAYRGGESAPAIAIGVGVVTRYDSTGIDAGNLYPSIGATLSFGRSGGG